MVESNALEIQKLVLGIGFLLQALRCFPWMEVNFFLKERLNADPSTLQIILNFTNLPMIAKPLYGIAFDTVYIRGQNRIPYIALGAFLQAVSWLAVAFLLPTNIAVLSVYLLVSNAGASIAEVANDAIVSELGKHPSSSSGEIESFIWRASTVGGLLGNLLCCMAVGRVYPHSNFKLFGLLLTLQWILTVAISERSLNLSKRPSSKESVGKQVYDFWSVLKQPEIAYPVIWFVASYAVIPDLTGAGFFFQTHHLKLDPSVLGLSKVFGQAATLLWSFVYNRRLNRVSPKKIICDIQVTMAIFLILDALSVEGFFERFGISDPVYTVFFSGFIDVLSFFKILPFGVLMAQICPPGSEGSLMAFATSAVALAFVVSGYTGVVLASFFGLDGVDFSKLPHAILIQAICTLLPLFWASWIPDETRSKQKRKKEE